MTAVHCDGRVIAFGATVNAGCILNGCRPFTGTAGDGTVMTKYSMSDRNYKPLFVEY